MRPTRIGGPIGALAIVVAALALLVAACGSVTDTPSIPAVPVGPAVPVAPPVPESSLPMPKGPLMAEFDRHLAVWKGSGITRYAFTYNPVCFCPLTRHLIVGDGDAVRIDGVPVDGRVAPPIGAPVGVDGLFEVVRQAIKGDSTIVSYDEATGVPFTMQSDPILNAVDDELDFTVTDWTLQPPNDAVLGQVALARRTWDREPPSRYVWSIAIDCDCARGGERFDMSVVDGNVTARSGGKRVSVEALEGVPLTVPDLFQLAVTAATTEDVTVAFDPHLAYPTRVEIHRARPNAIPSITYRVVSFRAG